MQLLHHAQFLDIHRSNIPKKKKEYLIKNGIHLIKMISRTHSGSKKKNACSPPWIVFSISLLELANIQEISPYATNKTKQPPPLQKKRKHGKYNYHAGNQGQPSTRMIVQMHPVQNLECFRGRQPGQVLCDPEKVEVQLEETLSLNKCKWWPPPIHHKITS